MGSGMILARLNMRKLKTTRFDPSLHLEPEEIWWARLPDEEQEERKIALRQNLKLRGMDIPDSEYGWANAAYEAEHA